MMITNYHLMRSGCTPSAMVEVVGQVVPGALAAEPCANFTMQTSSQSGRSWGHPRANMPLAVTVPLGASIQD